MRYRAGQLVKLLGAGPRAEVGTVLGYIMDVTTVRWPDGTVTEVETAKLQLVKD